MSVQHKDLARERWNQMPFLEQIANIGREVERALNWRVKQNTAYSQKAFERALDLLDMALDSHLDLARLRELARVREAMVDYFWGTNQFISTEMSWRKYFFNFTFAVRRAY